jgi:hypothetical protein
MLIDKVFSLEIELLDCKLLPRCVEDSVIFPVSIAPNPKFLNLVRWYILKKHIDIVGATINDVDRVRITVLNEEVQDGPSGETIRALIKESSSLAVSDEIIDMRSIFPIGPFAVPGYDKLTFPFGFLRP